MIDDKNKFISGYSDEDDDIKNLARAYSIASELSSNIVQNPAPNISITKTTLPPKECHENQEKIYLWKINDQNSTIKISHFS